MYVTFALISRLNDEFMAKGVTLHCPGHTLRYLPRSRSACTQQSDLLDTSIVLFDRIILILLLNVWLIVKGIVY